MEAVDTRPKIDQLRDKAVELISKSEEYQADVEKDLTSINNRWENFISQVKVRFVLCLLRLFSKFVCC